MNDAHVVVYDPANLGNAGTTIDGAKARVLGSKGGRTLPVDLEARRQGICFALAPWGDGYPIGNKTPSPSAPFCLYAKRSSAYLHWLALLVAEKGAVPGVGFATIASTQVGGILRCSVTPETRPYQAQDLGKREAYADGWFIGGRAALRLALDGPIALAIYGAMPGVRVAWIAASATER